MIAGCRVISSIAQPAEGKAIDVNKAEKQAELDIDVALRVCHEGTERGYRSGAMQNIRGHRER